MDQRVTMIMIGATDIASLRTFYEDGLGWVAWRTGGSGSVMYKVGQSNLVFLDAHTLAGERGDALSPGSKSTLATFVGSRADVDRAIERALIAGATLTSPARNRDGGLYSGYFADPEGNSWEVVWSPGMPLAADGSLTANGGAQPR